MLQLATRSLPKIPPSLLTMCGSSEGTIKACTPLPPSAAAMASLMRATLASAGALAAVAAGAAAPAAPAAADATPACCMRPLVPALLLGAATRSACKHNGKHGSRQARLGLRHYKVVCSADRQSMWKPLARGTALLAQ